jgi:hypothetical protein
MIRDYLTKELQTPGISDDVAVFLRKMRSASNEFLTDAGYDGQNFSGDQERIAHRLGLYHARMGEMLSLLALLYDVEFEEALLQIMPSDALDDLPVISSSDE